mmetsp:Transcript_108553/g.306974  ORF Transcript_108553/g.306974 Transcript_108553/m.306974 type:complete len:253 (+) Transcript_108553:215-973(+)
MWTAAMSRRRCTSANFVGGYVGWWVPCRERFPAPTWQPSMGTLNTVPSSVRIDSVDMWASPPPGSTRSSKVHWWQTRRSPFCTRMGWYFGHTMYDSDIGSPSGTTQTLCRWALDSENTQWNAAIPVLATSTMTVFRGSAPKLQGSCGRPCRPRREIKPRPPAKKRRKVDGVELAAPSAGDSTSFSAKESEAATCSSTSAATPGSSSSAVSMLYGFIAASTSLGLARHQADSAFGWLAHTLAKSSGSSMSKCT